MSRGSSSMLDLRVNRAHKPIRVPVKTTVRTPGKPTRRIKSEAGARAESGQPLPVCYHSRPRAASGAGYQLASSPVRREDPGREGPRVIRPAR